MIPKTSWIIFTVERLLDSVSVKDVINTVDATGVEVKVDFVRSTKIPDDKLRVILANENKKRHRHKKPPLRYEEFDPATKDHILHEAERQFMRDEGIGENAEFENFQNEIDKEEVRLESEGIKETAPPSPEKPKKENYKLPKGEEGINVLLTILQYLRDGRTNKKIRK